MTKLLVGAFTAIAACLAPVGAQADCTIYQHRDYGGVHWQMERNSFMQMGGGEEIGASVSHGTAPTSYYRPDWNDQVSSFRVSGGCTIVLYQHAGTWGYGATFRSNRSYRYVGDRWNDQASWAECNCPRRF
jgi:hypothetical protein